MHLPPSVEAQLQTSLQAQTDLTKANPRLEQALERVKERDLPPISVSPSFGRLLSILCKFVKAQSVLEIGTLGGYSTIWLAESMPGIKVTSIEFDPKHKEVAEQNTKGMDNIDIRLGAALDVLPQLQGEGAQFDLILIDADWPNQHRYFDWAVRLAKKGACIYVDNVVWKITRSQSQGDPEARALIEQIKSDERVEATLIPTLSNYDTDTRALVDGIVIAWVR